MKKYWKDSPSGKKNGSNKELKKEKPGKPEENILPASRRDFLKLCGFSIAGVALASCRQKINKAIPYVIAPEEIIPGESTYYSSTCINGNDYCSILVKIRDGRPIKIEGNPASSVTMGGTSARIQASVLDLYDGTRFHGPLKSGEETSWEVTDSEIISHLDRISSGSKKIVLLTPSIFSPSTEAVITGFINRYKGSEWVKYDAISHQAILQANFESFGQAVIPDYRFDKADVILGIGADFLGTWLSPIEYTARFSSRRIPGKDMNFLIQMESNLSLTGCNADRRITIKPSDELPVLQGIYGKIAGTQNNFPAPPVDVTEIAEKLLSAKGRCIVVSGSDNIHVQSLVNEINSLLGNIGNTILFDSHLRTHTAVDSDMVNLVSQMEKGEIGALLIWNANPAYTWRDRKAFNEGLKQVELTVALSGFPDETTRLAQYNCPDNHYLESWNDAEPKRGHFSLMQPVIAPVFNTRQAQETLLKWSGSDQPYYDFLKEQWGTGLMKRQKDFTDAANFFDNMLRTGVFEPGDLNQLTLRKTTFDPSSIKSGDAPGGGIELVLYEKISIGEGRQSNNPWLQELPDPITKICWNNYVCIPQSIATELNLSETEIVEIDGLEIPVHIQPGQANGTIAIALGYGRTNCGKVGDGVGVDAWALRNTHTVKSINKTGKMLDYLARTQTHHTMEGRALVREAGLKEFEQNPAAGNEMHEEIVHHFESLYPEREYPHHHWGMAIDLSKCTGCSACVIACQAENNIPVVGPEEVNRVHEMHWLRIDRYFSGTEEDPEVVFQPVPCQHCKNAPCENVCPVAATNHSSEGLNQMIYNRCFGTRYCNNNCPYKVRRFNWFNYTEAGTLKGNLRDAAEMTNDLRRMVLNPDVTVRSQGVIEKCSFCIQRIQAGKLKAKVENRPLKEGEITSACAQACPAGAIVFGDMNDEGSELRKLMDSGRRYNLLEELYTQPSVHYLTKIRNNNV